MAEVLVLVDHIDGAVRKTTSELLTIARRLGEPSAVLIGAGFDAAKQTLAQYGAEKIYRVESADIADYLVAPTAEVLSALVASAVPAAVLVSSSPEGKEIAARLAIKTGSGLITDAVDVQAGAGGAARTTQSVFAGGYTVQARHQGHAHHCGQAELGHAGSGVGSRPRAGRRDRDLPERQDGPDHRQCAQGCLWPSRADRGRDRGLRWSRHGR